MQRLCHVYTREMDGTLQKRLTARAQAAVSKQDQNNGIAGW